MKTKREKRREGARRSLKERTFEFKRIPEEHFPPNRPEGLTRVFRNNLFTVLIYDNKKDLFGNRASRVMVKHNFGKVVGWKELQFIKNSIFGKESLGYQFLPPESVVVDKVNMYWFFVKGKYDVCSDKEN